MVMMMEMEMTWSSYGGVLFQHPPIILLTHLLNLPLKDIGDDDDDCDIRVNAHLELGW